MKRTLGLLLIVSLSAVARSSAQTPQSYWINVLDYGAKGDAVTDDAPAILKAINAAIARRGPGSVVYFPPGSGYYGAYNIATPLSLPWPQGVWIKLFFDGDVILNATLTLTAGYILHGNSGRDFPQFSMDAVTVFGVGPNVNPAIYIHRAAGIRLENIIISWPKNGADGIVVDDDPDGQSAEITFNNVFVWLDQNNTTGVPVVIKGGFGYYFEGGGYASSALGSSPSIKFTNAIACNGVALVQMHRVFLNNHGVLLYTNCSPFANFTFDDNLYEDGIDPFLRIEGPSNSGAYGIRMQDNCVADSTQPVLAVHNTQAKSIYMVDNMTVNHVPVQGDPIQDLEIWTPDSLASLTQTSGYVLHTPVGITDTMPTSMPTLGSGSGSFALSPVGSGSTSESVKAGETAVFNLQLTSLKGFAGTISLACLGAPVGGNCQVSPAQVQLSASAQAPFTVSVATPTGSSNTVPTTQSSGRRGRLSWLIGSGVLFFTWIMMALYMKTAREERKESTGCAQPRWTPAMLSFALVVALCCVSCFGLKGSQSGPRPPQTVTVTVTATSGQITQKLSLMVTLQ